MPCSSHLFPLSLGRAGIAFLRDGRREVAVLPALLGVSALRRRRGPNAVALLYRWHLGHHSTSMQYGHIVCLFSAIVRSILLQSPIWDVRVARLGVASLFYISEVEVWLHVSFQHWAYIIRVILSGDLGLGSFYNTVILSAFGLGDASDSTMSPGATAVVATIGMTNATDTQGTVLVAFGQLA